MKEQILKIAKDLEQGAIADIEAQNLLLGLFGVSFSLPDANPHICPECGWQCTCSDQPCSCCNEH